MSDADRLTGGEQQRTVQIPSILTNSCRAILDAYGEDVVQLKAHGSIGVTNGTTVDRLSDYGLSWEQRDEQRLTLDYERLPGADGPANPLTTDRQEVLLEVVNERLDAPERNAEPDLAVSSLVVRVTDERLQAVTPARSPEFDFRFVSDRAEPDIRKVTKRYNADRGLYSELGFDARNLNLRSVVETEAKYHQQSDGKFFSWGGPTDLRPRAPEQLAIRVNNHILPDQYGVLKPYQVSDDQTLELVEDVADRLPDASPFGQTAGSEDST